MAEEPCNEMAYTPLAFRRLTVIVFSGSDSAVQKLDQRFGV